MKELYAKEVLKNKQKYYEHITKRERDIISKHLSAGKRISYIIGILYDYDILDTNYNIVNHRIIIII